MKKYLFVSVLLTTLWSSGLVADTSTQPDTVGVDSWHLGLTLGYGQIQSPLTDDDDIPLYILPDIRYFGERLSVENTTLGYSLKETPIFAVELSGYLNQDGLYFPGSHRGALASLSSQFSRGSRPLPGFEVDLPDLLPEEKSLSYMTGLRVRYYNKVKLSMALAYDVTAGHHGYEGQLSAKKGFSWQSIEFELLLQGVYKSQQLVEYYYGVGDADLPDTFAFQFVRDYYLHQPSSAFNYISQLQLAYPIQPTLWLVGSLRYEWLDSDIRHSPLVKEDHVQSYFLGIKKVF